MPAGLARRVLVGWVMVILTWGGLGRLVLRLMVWGRGAGSPAGVLLGAMGLVGLGWAFRLLEGR